MDGLYEFVLKSKAKHAEVFQHWICSEVFPSLSDNKCHHRSDNITKDELQDFANARQDRLYHEIVEHIKIRDHDAVLQAVFGEHLPTKRARINATNTSYRGGQSDTTNLRGSPNGV